MAGHRRRVVALPAAPQPADPGRDSGMSTIELVLLAPLMIMFVMFVVAFGLIVDAKGQAYGAARDAARAGALQRDYGAAMTSAQQAAEADLGNKCIGVPVVRSVDSASEAGSDAFASGGLFTVQVTCTVSLAGLNLLGIGPAKTVTARATAPLDTYRRVGTP